MRVRCAYCKAEFALEAQGNRLCPHCGKAAILPRPAQSKSLRIGRPDRTDGQSEQTQGLGGFLFLAQQPFFLMALGIVTVVGLAVYFTSTSPAGAGKIPMQAVARQPENIAARETTVLQIALENFKRDCGKYPDESEGLVALLNNPGEKGWKGPYVTLLRPDPWDRLFVYRAGTSESGYVLLSVGPDGIEGTADDITPGPLAQQLPAVCPFEAGGSAGSGMPPNAQTKGEATR